MSDKDSWGSRIGLILAMAGNAIGLGNFLRFPVQAMQNGGGAFIIPYLVCFLVMGIPLLWIEWGVGRYGGRRGNHSTPFILDQMGHNRFWKYFGVFGIFTNIAVAAYYCYIESWTLAYVYHSLIQTFQSMGQSEVATFFLKYVDVGSSTSGIPYESVVFYVVCLLLNIWILSRGLSGGVERVAKIGIPLLMLFGLFLAVKGWTLGSSGSPTGCTDCNSWLGMDYLWKPQFDSLWNPKVWLAAAGQIFFTLSVGMGTIQCYAAYVRPKDDIALNAMSAGWMNGFVEIVLGASIVIPIAVGYLGLDWVKENAGFSMAFQTMPFLFNKWGVLLGTVAGVMWFGLLFFAGITSSLAMGTPWMGFMCDEFGWKTSKAAWSFGALVLVMGLPTVLFYDKGVFDEYDYWAGTVSLVVFALAETILFAWILGIDKGWAEITRGADMKVPSIYKPIIKYVTPTFLLAVFLGALFTPKDNDWLRAVYKGWELDPSSIIGNITHKGLEANRSYFSDRFESEVAGSVDSIQKQGGGGFVIHISSAKSTESANQTTKSYPFESDADPAVAGGDSVKIGSPIARARGAFTNKVFYIDMARIGLLGMFAFVAWQVHRATIRRKRLGIPLESEDDDDPV
ncbi:MAG: sodium:calcium symporter [Sphingomonadales bacterium]|nr:sodium:calcium symporter [Sphingomonadales bacterium]